MDCRGITTKIKSILEINQALFSDYGAEGFDADRAINYRRQIDEKIDDLVVELEKTDAKLMTVEEAAKLFGDRFFGPELADRLLGKRERLPFDERKVAAPEFSRFELLRAYNDGAKLIYRRQKDSNENSIADLADLAGAVEKVKAETGLEIEIVDNGFNLEFLMGQNWALVYDMGNDLSYREQFLNLENIAREKKVDFDLMQGGRERISSHKKKVEKIVNIENTGEADEIKYLYSRDDLSNVMRPSAIDMTYDLLMMLLQNGSVQSGDFWTSTVIDKPIVVKVRIKDGRVTIEFVEKDVSEAGPVFVMNRLGGMEKFNRVIERNRERDRRRRF